MYRLYFHGILWDVIIHPFPVDAGLAEARVLLQLNQRRRVWVNNYIPQKTMKVKYDIHKYMPYFLLAIT